MATRRVVGMVGGAGLVVHGLAHALPGMQFAAGAYSPVLDVLRVGQAVIIVTATLLWSAAMTGFVAAGFGSMGAAAFRAHWRGLASVAAIASLVLLLFWSTPWTVPGMIIDIGVLVRVRNWNGWLAKDVPAPGALPARHGGEP